MLLPLPLDEPFDYAPPADVAPGSLAPGNFVEVPFGPRQVIGRGLGRPTAGRVAAPRLKTIRRRMDAPPMPQPCATGAPHRRNHAASRSAAR